MSDRSEAHHAPTPQRLHRAQREGKVVRSRDLIWAGIWISCLSCIAWLSPVLLNRWKGWVSESWSGDVASKPLFEGWQSASSMLLTVLPVLLVILCGTIVLNLVQGGFGIYPDRVRPQLSRLMKEKKGISIESLLKSTTTLLKIVCLFSVTAVFLFWNRESLMSLGGAKFDLTFAAGTDLVFAFCLQIAIVLACFGVIDYGIARFEYQNDLRMSDQELKDEQRQLDGDPRVQSARSVIHRERTSRQPTKSIDRIDFLVIDGRTTAFGMSWVDRERDLAKLVWREVGVSAVQAISSAASRNLEIRRDSRLSERIAKLDLRNELEV